MCGPKLCAMRISDDVRKFAAEHQASPDQALAIGTEEKAREFREASGEIYVPEIAKS